MRRYLRVLAASLQVVLLPFRHLLGQRHFDGGHFVLGAAGGTNSVIMKRPLPRTNPPMCIPGVPSGALALQGHWMLPSSSILSKLTPAKVGVRRAISSIISEGCWYGI